MLTDFPVRVVKIQHRELGEREFDALFLIIHVTQANVKFICILSFARFLL